MQALNNVAAGRIEPGQHQSKADVLLRVVIAAAKAIDASRQVGGRRPGQPSAGAADGQLVVIERRTMAG